MGRDCKAYELRPCKGGRQEVGVRNGSLPFNRFYLQFADWRALEVRGDVCIAGGMAPRIRDAIHAEPFGRFPRISDSWILAAIRCSKASEAEDRTRIRPEIH